MDNNYQFIPPSGELTEEHAVEIAEHLIRIKADKFKFRGYEREDIEQEIFFACVKALPKFDRDKMKGNPMKFFNMVTENHLRNLKRDKLYAFRPPCERCKHAKNKDGKYEKQRCNLFKNSKDKCSEYQDYLKAFDTKVNLSNPISLYIQTHPQSAQYSSLGNYLSENSFESVDAFESFSYCLTGKQKEWLKAWCKGESVNKARKERIIKRLKQWFDESGV